MGRSVFGPVLPGQSRWLRLRPADLIDLLLGALMAVGLLLYVAGWFTPGPRLPAEGLQLVSDLLFRAHGSTPLLFFLGAAVYLARWGRTMGRHKMWLVIGVLLTLPLWFLAGLPVGVKGVGDITLLMVPWNLLALGLMLLGVRRTLGAPREQDPKPRQT